MRNLALLAGATIVLAACAQDRGGYDTGLPAPATGYATAQLTGPSSMDHGSATFTQLDEGVRVVIEAERLDPGVHGAHIHETGSCIGPDFSSAGGHWNPFNREHGRDNPAGRHMGDMPNIIIGQDGSGLLEVVLEGATIAGGRAALLDDDGSAVMIHAGPDDYRTDPAGAAGPRVACGEVVPG